MLFQTRLLLLYTNLYKFTESDTGPPTPSLLEPTSSMKLGRQWKTKECRSLYFENYSKCRHRLSTSWVVDNVAFCFIVWGKDYHIRVVASLFWNCRLPYEISWRPDLHLTTTSGVVDDYPMLLLTTTQRCCWRLPEVVMLWTTTPGWKVVNYPMLFGWWLPNCDAVDDYPMLLLTTTQTCHVVDDNPMLHNRHVGNSVTTPCTQTNHPKWTTAPANYFDNRRPGRNMTHSLDACKPQAVDDDYHWPWWHDC